MDISHLIAIDQDLTRTGVAKYIQGEYEIELIKSERREKNCPVCGKVLKDPNSKAHLNSKFHKNALKDKKESGIEIENITFSPSIEYTQRIMAIRDQITKLCNEYPFQFGIIEGMAYSANGNVIFDLGGLSHMIREVFFQHNIKFIVIPPTVAKKYWTKKGNASKEEMIEETKKRGWEIPFDYDDNCNDAFAFLQFLKEFVEGTLAEKWISKVEYSWKVEL